MDNVYSTIAERLNTQLNEQSVITNHGKLQYVDLFNNQFELITQETVLPLPAILIEIGAANWKSMAQATQKGDTLIRVHIGQQTLADSYWNSNNKQTALKVLQYIKLVHYALQNFSGTNFNKLDRVNSDQDVNHTNLIVHTMDYMTNITEIVPKEVVSKTVTTEVLKGGAIPPEVLGTDYNIPG